MSRKKKVMNEWRQAAWVLVLLLPVSGAAKAKRPKTTPLQTSLESYLQRVRSASPAVSSSGSLWSPDARFTDLASDYKARGINDLIVIRISEQTTAQADSSVKSQRGFAASSGMSGLLGLPGQRSGLQTLFSPNSTRALSGQAQTASSSSLSTSLSGHVVEVLSNGFLVVEAVRQVEMNNQRQTLIVRGVVRPADLAPDNSVLSSSLGHLEVELLGKGVISDGVSPPNRLVRLLLKLVEF